MKNTCTHGQKRSMWSIYLLIVGIVFSILFLVLVLVLLTVKILIHVGVFVLQPGGSAIGLVAALAVYLAIGIIYTIAIIRFIVKPVMIGIYSLYDLVEGKFETRIDIGMFPPIKKEYSRSFNKLAEELQNTKMFRSDFINNFSHEFKSPIVAINGFAKLLQKGGVPPEKEREYLDIIAAESNRLADLATKVLTLTRVNNQMTLNDEEEYNLSEQLRSCILLFVKKWEAKKLTVDAEFSEVEIVGS